MQSPMHHAIQYGVAGKSGALQKEQDAIAMIPAA